MTSMSVAARPVAFRLDTDPGERRLLRPQALGDDGRTWVATLDDEVRRAVALRERLALGPESSMPDPEVLERLRELGYIRDEP